MQTKSNHKSLAPLLVVLIMGLDIVSLLVGTKGEHLMQGGSGPDDRQSNCMYTGHDYIVHSLSVLGILALFAGLGGLALVILQTRSLTDKIWLSIGFIFLGLVSLGVTFYSLAIANFCGVGL
jgi:hypothetical protein